MDVTQHPPAVLELVVADAHGVVAHGDHEFEGQLAVGELGQSPGEDVARVEQEGDRGTLAFLFDQRRELGDPSDLIDVVPPEGRDGIVGALKVVGVEQRHLAQVSGLQWLGLGCMDRGDTGGHTEQDHHGPTAEWMLHDGMIRRDK